MTVVDGSYRAVEQPGGGHRASAADVWRGEFLPTGAEVAMTMLPADAAEVARRVAGEVAAIRHPHLLPVRDLVEDEDRVAIITDWPPGGRLAELVARRGRLSVGETLTVLIPLADALAAAHAGGTRHGGVCPEAIWFDQDGRPLLGALAVSLTVAELNQGLPAGSRDVAPELVRGESIRGGPVTVAADVFSLGSVALRCLTGRSAWPADDAADVLVQSAAGQWPDPADDVGPPALIDLVRAMLRADPDRRPSAAGLASRLSRVGEAVPVRFGPGPVPASADRWRGWDSLEQPSPAGTSEVAVGSSVHDVPESVVGAGRSGAGGSGAGGSGAGDAGAGGSGDIASGENGPVATSSGATSSGATSSGATSSGATSSGATGSLSRRWRRVRSRRRRSAELTSAGVQPAVNPTAARREVAVPDGTDARRPTSLARVGIAVLGGLLVTLVAAQVGLWWNGVDGPATASDTANAPAAQQSAPPSWPDVITALDAARARALATADPALLGEVYVEASAAGVTDAATIGQLAEQGWRVVGGVHQIVSVTVDSPNDSPNDGPNDSPNDSPVGGPGESAAAGPASPGPVRLAVVDTLASHPIVDADGRQVGLTPARAEQRRIFVMVLTGNGYRISAVEPG